MRVVPIWVTIDTMLNFDISEYKSVDVDATYEWTKIEVILAKETTSLLQRILKFFVQSSHLAQTKVMSAWSEVTNILVVQFTRLSAT